jgi:hypothetical protein
VEVAHVLFHGNLGDRDTHQTCIYTEMVTE